jgi:hypothetical protein
MHQSNPAAPASIKGAPRYRIGCSEKLAGLLAEISQKGIRTVTVPGRRKVKKMLRSKSIETRPGFAGAFVLRVNLVP